MFILVTIGTGQLTMFRRIGVEKLHRLTMTRRAVAGRNVLWVCDDRGHVNRVARNAGLIIHFLRVFNMAIHATGDLAVLQMTLITGQLCVHARMLFQFISLDLMTG